MKHPIYNRECIIDAVEYAILCIAQRCSTSDGDTAVGMDEIGKIVYIPQSVTLEEDDIHDILSDLRGHKYVADIEFTSEDGDIMKGDFIVNLYSDFALIY